MRHSYLDHYCDIDSVIHRIDPRIKLISLLGSILFVILTPANSFIAFAFYGVVISLLLIVSKIPVGFILKRSLVIIPFVVAIALFIPFFKQGQIVGRFYFGTFPITITYEGLMIFWNIIAKAYLSILCMILLSVTTKFSDLLKAMENLKLPRIIVMIMSFMYRYIFVIIDELMSMKRAMDSRASVIKRHSQIKVLARLIGVLFVRSYERAERVYAAMCSRGFSGKIVTLKSNSVSKFDICFLICLFFVFALIRFNLI